MATLAIQKTLSKHIAHRLCLDASLDHQFSFGGLSASVPWSATPGGASVSLTLQNVKWSPHTKDSALPLFGTLSAAFTSITIRLPADEFFAEVPRPSILGGDITLDSKNLEMEFVGATLDMPRLGIAGAALVSSSGTSKFVATGATCTSLVLRADGKSLLTSSKILRRRLGKILFGHLATQSRNLAADQEVAFSGVSDATLMVRLQEPLEAAFSLTGGKATLVDDSTAEVNIPSSPVRISAMLETQQVPSDGSVRPPQHYVTNYEDKVFVSGLPKVVESLASPASARLLSEARRLKAEEFGARHRASFSAREGDRRLAATFTPVMIGSGHLKTGSCTSIGCRTVSTAEQCRKNAIELGLESTEPSKVDQHNSPAGCFFQSGGHWPGLYFNSIATSDVGAGLSSMGGNYEPICECSAAMCPVQAPAASSLQLKPDSGFGCLSETKGNALPKALGEVASSDSASLPDKDFDTLCPAATAVRSTAFDDPTKWNTAPTTAGCFSAILSGSMAANFAEAGAAFRVLVRSSGFVSSTITLKSLPLAGIGTLSTVPARIMRASGATDSTVLAEPSIATSAVQAALPTLFNLGSELILSGDQSHFKISLSSALAVKETFASVGFQAPSGFHWTGAPEPYPMNLGFDSIKFFVHIGSTTSQSSLLKPAAGQATAGGATYARLASPFNGVPYACAKVSTVDVPNGKGKSLLVLGKESAGFATMDLKNIQMNGEITFNAASGFGTALSFDSKGRFEYAVAEQDWSIEAWSTKPLAWTVPEVSTTLSMSSSGSWKGNPKSFNSSNVVMTGKGCGFGELPYVIGGVKPDLYVSADLTGDLVSGFGSWQVKAALDNVYIDSAVKDASLVVTVDSTAKGLTSVEGTALLEVSMAPEASGEMQKPQILIPIKYDALIKGFKAEGRGMMHIAPRSWGLPPASVAYKFSPNAAPKVFASANLSGSIQVGAFVPGATASIPVLAAVGTNSPFYYKGSSTVTLPPSLGGKSVDLQIRMDGAGLTAEGVAAGLNAKLVDVPSSLNAMGIGDLTLDSATTSVTMGLSAKPTSAKAGILLKGKVGGRDAEGTMAFSKIPCFAVKAEAELDNAMAFVGLKRDLLDTVSFVSCPDASILEDAQIPKEEAYRLVSKLPSRPCMFQHW
eukprot:TRINITY_DN11729_c0_g1_i1.p1 TRINITY_DN11729_c0_g1~~TRINITY_DN11729_c0_g1_i1.p1  ORF type:complete len:1260 (-),score=316.34 TRINITY_DN11729_c0_g1_i1:1175-4597(-)